MGNFVSSCTTKCTLNKIRFSYSGVQATDDLFDDEFDDIILLAAEENVSKIPVDFKDFPYENAYPQQLELMKFIYGLLQNGQCGLIESPTGTGKSATMLTSCLRWLVDHCFSELDKLKEYQQELEETYKSESCGLDWISAHEVALKTRKRVTPEIMRLEEGKKSFDKTVDLRKEYLFRLSANKENIKTNLDTFEDLFGADVAKKMATEAPEKMIEIDSDNEFILDEKEERPVSDSPIKEKSSEQILSQIYFCSRTHSQLNQLLHEFNKININLRQYVTVLSLASRQSLCVYKPVYDLGQVKMINEACLDLNKPGKKGCGCKSKSSVNRLSEALLSSCKSAAEFAEKYKGSKSKKPICPYYANREGMKQAHVIFTPYNIILQKSSRQASGINLRNSIVIFDEAHNLMDAIESTLSVTLRMIQLKSSAEVFQAYMSHYLKRLSPISVLMLKQLQKICSEFVKYLDSLKCCKDFTNKLIDPSELLFSCHIDQLNIGNLVNYLTANRTIHKIRGFYKWKMTRKGVRKADEKGSNEMEKILIGMKRKRDEIEASPCSFDEHSDKISSAGLLNLQQLLTLLCETHSDGKIFISSTDRDISMRYTILDPGKHVTDIISECRSVLLAGGTMKPFDLFKEQLFKPANIPDEKVKEFTCGHVIDVKKQLKVYIPPVDTNETWKFNFNSRNDPSLMTKLGHFIFNLTNSVTAGIIVFVPSYDYLNCLIAHWRKSGQMDRFSWRKHVFVEPTSNSEHFNQMILDYRKYSLAGEETNKESSKRKGALLFCVIGSKLSEGINFSDGMCRASIIVGLPYPNPTCPLLCAKMAYLNSMYSGNSNASAGSRHYDSLCMRAVNQAIGRAIRHVKDYAVVVLLDVRYSKQSVYCQLPDWLHPSINSDLRTWNNITSNIEHFLQTCAKTI